MSIRELVIPVGMGMNYRQDLPVMDEWFSMDVNTTQSEAPTCRGTVVVRTPHGLHFGPCAIVAQLAQRFTSQITLEHGTKTADAKSVLDLATLAAEPGVELKLTVIGTDAVAAFDQLTELFRSDFSPV